MCSRGLHFSREEKTYFLLCWGQKARTKKNQGLEKRLKNEKKV